MSHRLSTMGVMTNAVISDQYIEEVRRQFNRCSPGARWHWKGYGLVESSSGYQICLHSGEEDGRFIAMSRTAIPRLLNAVENANAEIDSLRGQVDRLSSALRAAGVSAHHVEQIREGES